MTTQSVRLPLMLDIQAEVTDGTVQAVSVVAPSGRRQDITQYLDEDQMATVQHWIGRINERSRW
jgi:hypothetical protein